MVRVEGQSSLLLAAQEVFRMQTEASVPGVVVA